MKRDLRASIQSVVVAGNCSGCGGCAALFGSVNMELNPDGFMRPVCDDHAGQNADPVSDLKVDVRAFRKICPGVSVKAARWPLTRNHPTMGPYVSAWSACAQDAELRYAGSSGGVLSALSLFLIESKRVTGVIGASMSKSAPTRTVSLTLSTKADVLRAAGSRYAPVSNGALYEPQNGELAMVGKPCEIYSARKMNDVKGLAHGRPGPVLLSFFCAGVPSQIATENLIVKLGMEPNEVRSSRYRGMGWPGDFVVEDIHGRSATSSYEESWGRHLGPRVQERCKICPDGTGGHADIAVGDYWRSDNDGYPLFADAAGTSVAIARTVRGHDLLMAARDAGVIALGDISLDDVAAVQPLQVKRRMTLWGRLVGRMLAGQRVPWYRGFSMLGFVIRSPKVNLITVKGAFSRAKASGSGEGRSSNTDPNL